jgi:excisionase family DNA binding protein
MEKLCLSVVETALLLSISKSTVYALCEQNSIPHIRITEKRIVIPVNALSAWIAERSKQGVGLHGKSLESSI